MTKRVERASRIPLSGARDILSVPNQDPNYVYRWVRDDGFGRIDKFKQAGYEPVTTEGHKVGQKAVDSGTRVGSAITQTRGTSTLVLMRIPKEWYEEDQAAKQAAIDELEATMHAEATNASDFGKLMIKRNKK